MNEGLKIDLNSSTRAVVKTGLVLRALAILFTLLIMVFFGIEIYQDSVIIALIFFTIGLGLFIVFSNILNAAFFKECVIVTKNNITICRTNLSGKKQYAFKLDDIRTFGFADQKYTKHAMDNPIIDFTGLATQERELQYIIDEGNIKIETDTSSIKFGKNMPSWDVEELLEKIENFTGRRFTSPQTQPSDETIYTSDEDESSKEVIEDENPDPYSKKTNYSCEEGELVIEQQGEVPSVDDKAFLNGRPAPTGKYQIAEKQFVFVSNGIIYAVRI